MSNKYLIGIQQAMQRRRGISEQKKEIGVSDNEAFVVIQIVLLEVAV